MCLTCAGRQRSGVVSRATTPSEKEMRKPAGKFRKSKRRRQTERKAWETIRNMSGKEKRRMLIGNA